MMLSFQEVIDLAKKNAVKSAKEIDKSKFPRPSDKKKNPELDEKVRKYKEKQEKEKKSQELAKRIERDNLVNGRDRKEKGRIGRMTKLTKSSLKTFDEDTKNSYENSISMQELHQPDEDDYGFVSSNADEYHLKFLQTHNPRQVIPAKKPSVINTSKPLGRQARNSSDHSKNEPPEAKNGNGNKTEPSKPKRDPKKQLPPPPDFNTLLQIAEANKEKPFDPDILIRDSLRRKKEFEFERPMTSKEKEEYKKEKAVKEKVAKGEFVLKTKPVAPIVNNSKSKSSKSARNSSPPPHISAPSSYTTKRIPRNEPQNSQKSSQVSRPSSSSIGKSQNINPRRLSKSEDQYNPERPSLDSKNRCKSMESKSSTYTPSSDRERHNKGISGSHSSTNNLPKQQGRKPMESNNQNHPKEKLHIPPNKKRERDPPYIKREPDSPPSMSRSIKKERRSPSPPPAKKSQIKREPMSPPRSRQQPSKPMNGESSKGIRRPYTEPDLYRHPAEKKRRPEKTGPKRLIIESDEEYDSEMDDFIDDSEVPGDEISNMISSIFKYDRNKYMNEESDDDCMEASYADVEKEERRSLQIGIREDREEELREEMEKKRALERSKAKAKLKRNN